jgi:hypothetical protein
MTWRVVPAKPGQKPDCNLLTFIFFLSKRRRFDFFKIEIDPDDLVKTRNPSFEPDRVLKLYLELLEGQHEFHHSLVEM